MCPASVSKKIRTSFISSYIKDKYEWLNILLLCRQISLVVLRVPKSNPEARYPDCGVSCFSLIHYRQTPGQCQLGQDNSPPHALKFTNLPTTKATRLRYTEGVVNTWQINKVRFVFRHLLTKLLLCVQWNKRRIFARKTPSQHTDYDLNVTISKDFYFCLIEVHTFRYFCFTATLGYDVFLNRPNQITNVANLTK